MLENLHLFIVSAETVLLGQQQEWTNTALTDLLTTAKPTDTENPKLF